MQKTSLDLPEYVQASGHLDAQFQELSGVESDTNTPVLVLWMKDHEFSSALASELAGLVSCIPIVEYREDEVKPAGFGQQALFLVTDYRMSDVVEQFRSQYTAALFMIVADELETSLPGNALCYLQKDENLAFRLVRECVSRLFPGFDDPVLALRLQLEQKKQLLSDTGKELSRFYHNINNPLTILSGNIQLLQLLTSSMDVSEDLLKPINDIASIIGRIEEDLKTVSVLKERIREQGAG